jgi:hypothetical protein
VLHQQSPIQKCKQKCKVETKNVYMNIDGIVVVKLRGKDFPILTFIFVARCCFHHECGAFALSNRHNPIILKTPLSLNDF